MNEIPYQIFAEEKFLSVIDIFKSNFESKQEHGAQFCAYKNGELILDLHGGWADKKKSRVINPSTLFSVFSSGKAVASLVIAHLVEQNYLSYDQLVSSIWPEFAEHGKNNLTIAQLLSHQSGLSGISCPNWTNEDWYSWEKTCNTLANQKPIFLPGKLNGYHPITFGFLIGEIARRADKDMRSLGKILREDICDPNNLDIWIGLPKNKHNDCSEIIKPNKLANLGEINAATEFAFLKNWSTPNPKPLDRWREAEFAGNNCHANAKSLAQIMQMAVNGNINTKNYLSEEKVLSLRKSHSSGPDLVLPFILDFGAGLMKNAPNYFYGPYPETVGHSGWGGSCVFADHINGISGAYVMNKQNNTLIGDLRPKRIIDEMYNCL
ncbi:MAG: serine hydrolase domain-containing protein [Hellea sp.]